MKKILPVLLLGLAVTAQAQKKYYMLVGTYTGGKSKGIYVYDFNTTNASVILVDSAATSNPSYLTASPDGKAVFCVNENANNGMGGGITSFSFDKNSGHLTELSRALTMGDHPCYISVDKTGKWVMVGNYTSGSATLLSVRKDYSLWLKTTMYYNKFRENVEKKQASHVHATVFSKDNKYAFIPDLGSDKIWTYRFDASKGKLTETKDSFVRLPDSSGPRHFVFHPSGKWAYLIQELSGTVTVFSYHDGHLKKIQSRSSLPLTYRGPARSADIHVSPDGKFLYASNRDPSNNIAIFSISAETGMITLEGHQSTLGKTPRNFNFDPSGNFLLVANQNSDNIVVFRVNHQTGMLEDTGRRIDVGNPVCVKWIEK